MIQVERGHGAVMRVTALDGETPLIADDDPTVVLTNWAGDTIGDPINSTAGDTIGEYRATFPAQTDLGPLTATWSFTVDAEPWTITDTIVVVAGFYFELAALRARPGMERVDRYSPAALVDARHWAEDLAERVTHTSFVERFHLETITGSWDSNDVALYKPWGRELIAVLVDGTAVDNATLSVTGGWTTATAPTWPDGTNATIAYTAAHELAPPVDLRDALIEAARWHLITTLGGSAIPPNSTTVQATPGGSIATGTADIDHPTGIPDVDAVLLDYRRRCMPALIA